MTNGLQLQLTPVIESVETAFSASLLTPAARTASFSASLLPPTNDSKIVAKFSYHNDYMNDIENNVIILKYLTCRPK